jgi:hypothetical protein
MSLIQMNAEQMRAKGLKNHQEKLQEQKNYQAKVDNLSKTNVGGLYDIRSILKSEQFKEQKNHYSVQQAEEEFQDMLQSYGMFKEAELWKDYIKRSGKNLDSFQIRLLGKRVSDMLESFKIKHDIK